MSECFPETGVVSGLDYSLWYTPPRGDEEGQQGTFRVYGRVCKAPGLYLTIPTHTGDPSDGTLSIWYEQASFSFDENGIMKGLGSMVQGWSGTVRCAGAH